MRKLITFLGKGKYDETTYRWDKLEYTTRYFAEAVANWLRPDCVYVLLTPEAETDEKKHWPNLKERLEAGQFSVVPEKILSGQDAIELWQIFQAIEQRVVDEGDELIFDITHGYRSLPILFLLVVAYLRQIRDVKLLHILYGAYDARDKEKNITPVYEITPLVSLLDWLTAAKIFMTTGDGRELAELMENAQNQAFRHGAPNPPRQLKKLGQNIREVSENLLISRIPLLAQSAQKLQATLGQETLMAEIEAWLPPLAPLFSQIQQRYAVFAQDDLPTQLKLIQWYEAHGHLVQAYTLAREWLVNYGLYRQGLWDSRNIKSTREEVEKQLSHAARGVQEGDPHSKANLIAVLWSRLGNYRNDIAHCGFREDSKPAATLRQDLQQVITQLELLLQEVQRG